MLINCSALKREGNVIHLDYKDIIMIKKEMIYRNPLIKLGYENEDILQSGGFGAVLAHAGVGKTALLVQVALNAMLREQSVLHVSLNDAVSKVDIWYQELFHNIAANFDAAEIQDHWISRGGAWNVRRAFSPEEDVEEMASGAAAGSEIINPFAAEPDRE